MDWLVPKETEASPAKPVYLDLVVQKVTSGPQASPAFKVPKEILV
jgi:hypothetical protein